MSSSRKTFAYLTTSKYSKALLALWLICANGYAENIQFNTDVLDIKDRKNVDLSEFSRAGYIMPGAYDFNVRINGLDDVLLNENINWVVTDNDSKDSEPCLVPKLVAELGLKPAMHRQLKWWHHNQCLDVNSLAGMTTRGDLGTNTLYLNIPQAYLQYQSANWDPPSRWDNGVPGVLFDYYLSGQSRTNLKRSGGSENNLNGNGTAGANWGPWRLRADWQARFDEASGNTQNARSWDWSRFYMYRALPQMRAKLTLGEGSLYSDIFDSFSFTGASLLSDDNMLPPNLRGYAPEITGVAKSNAKVIISHQGRILEQTQVAAGPFRISDLNDMVSGVLNVRVEEQDGSVQTFTVNTATIPYLTRPGRFRYKVAAGRPSDSRHHIDGPAFTTGEFSWGINNGWSLYGGGIGGENYNALALGIGRDLMAFGAISLDTTQARAQFPHKGETSTGGSYRLSYSKRFDETDSQVTFAGYRFSQRHFMSMGEYLDTRQGNISSGRGKEMYTVTLNQQFRDLNLSAYLDYSHQTYWNRLADDRYTVTVARFFDLGRIRNLSLSASAYRNRYFGTHDDGMYLSLSVPWSDNGTLSYNGTVSRSNNAQQVSYNGRTPQGDSYQLSAGMADEGATTSAYWGHDADTAHIDTNIGYQAGSYRSVSLSARGGATATPEGLALHRINMPGGTRLLLDTNGIPDIPVQGFGSNTRTNHFGKAVVADVSSYYRNRVSIDLDNLPDNADASQTVVQATLTDGAIGYRKFDVISGKKGMAVVRLADGSYPPFGTAVQNARHQGVGLIGDQGEVYLSGMQPGENMTLVSDSTAICTLTLPLMLPENMLQQQLLLPCKPGAVDASKTTDKSKHQSLVGN